MAHLNPLDIVYCKNCKYYRTRQVNAHSSIHSCLKDNPVDIDGAELYCNRPCYSKRLIRKKVLKKN